MSKLLFENYENFYIIGKQMNNNNFKKCVNFFSSVKQFLAKMFSINSNNISLQKTILHHTIFYKFRNFFR